MHITLPSDSGSPQSGSSDDAFYDLLADPVWQALRSGAVRLPLAPNFSDDEVKSLLDKLREPKMMEQLQDLLTHLPQESQHLLDSLQDSRLQSA